MGKKKSTKKQISKSGLITLQWLTYDFWAFSVVELTFIVAILGRYYGGYNTIFRVEETIYPVVASIILLSIAFSLDVYYSRIEKNSKIQGSSIVKIIHSVIFAIVTAVSLVTTLFVLISNILNSYSINSSWEGVTVSSTLFIGFGLLFLRTLKYDLFKGLRKTYRFLMLGLVVIGILLTLTGPFVKAMELRKPIMVREILNSFSYSMSDYASANKKLPENLYELANSNYFSYMDYNKSAVLELLDTKTITYRANIKSASSESYQRTYYYELCGTFEKALESGLDIKVPMMMIYTEYPVNLSLTDVIAGTHCYKLSTIAHIKQL